MFYILLVLLIIILEWKIKNFVAENYDFSRQTFLLKKKLRIHKYHNEGAFLNFMEHKKKLLHAVSVLFTLIIFLFFLLTLFQKGNVILKLGLSLLLGGAFSNTYDRLSKKYVIDYVSFCTPFSRFNQIVFNISDFCIIIGAFFLVLSTS